MSSPLFGMRQVANDLAAASAKGFQVSGSGAEALINAVTDMQNKVILLIAGAAELARELPLGQTPAAQVYKPFMASLATDPHQGFIPFLKSLQEDLASIEKSLRSSMTAYADSDQGGAHGITNAGN